MSTMGPTLVVELSSAFDEYLGLGPAAEPFAIRQFVAAVCCICLLQDGVTLN